MFVVPVTDPIGDFDVNFLLADCPRLRCIELCLLSGESFADENLVRTVPQRASLIFEYCKISPERFTCSAPLSVNFVLCIECCDGTSIYLSHKYGHGLLPLHRILNRLTHFARSSTI